MAIPAKKQENFSMTTTYGILFAIGSGHLLHDAIQSVVPALFPILERSLSLTYGQIGWIGFVLMMTSSVMQPVFGYFADARPLPFLLPFGMSLSLIGLFGLGFAPNFYLILLSTFIIGLGSAVFHPEGSRVAYMAAGPRRGLAQSIYQVGGNLGQSMAPVFTAFIFVPLGQKGALAFTLVAAVAVIILLYVSRWYRAQLAAIPVKTTKKEKKQQRKTPIHAKIKIALVLLVFIVFARSWYTAGIKDFYQFYLIEDYGLTIRQAQVYIFTFMIAGVIGTFSGGPLADRFGKRNVMLLSLVGAAPFTLVLPYVPLYLVFPLFLLIGVLIFSSFSVSVVYAQELLPNKVGMVSGLIVGLAFGMGGIGAVLIGTMADLFSLKFVMILCSLLPVLGVLTWLLPSDQNIKRYH